MKNLVSIIIPVYNVSKYIERCIQSVMNQTYTNIECIIVDDVTPDDSIEKCEKMIATYEGPISFTILHHEKNRGLSASRNTGTKAAHGEYIYYFDSDDEITSNCVELLMGEVESNPDVEMVQGLTKAVPSKKYYKKDFLKEIDDVHDNLWIRQHFYRIKNEGKLPVNAWDKLIKREFLEQHSLYFKEGLIHEDEMWMFYVVKHLTHMCFVHEPTYIHYCGTEGSIMSTNSRKRQAYHWSVILNEVIQNLDEPLRKNQLLTYLLRLVKFFGKDGKISYDELLKKYSAEVYKSHFYLIFVYLKIFQILYGLDKGYFSKKLVYKLILLQSSL